MEESSTVRVWTKQHENILEDLEANGRYIVKREYIVQKMEDHADLYLDVYDWFYHGATRIVPAPDDVKYPIWVSLNEGEKIGNSPGNVGLELEVDPKKLIVMDMDKWGLIVNYGYIPKDREDADRHDELLSKLGVDDCGAYQSPFYPQVKHDIIKSWDRLFDESIVLSSMKVGTLWEIKADWIVKVER